MSEDIKRSIWLGWDPREETAWEIARSSLLRHCTQPIPVHKLFLEHLRHEGIYTRPTERSAQGRLLDKLSARSGYDGSMATEHANARFFVPLLARHGWAMFTDGDVLFRGDVAPLFDSLQPDYAVYCVKHNHQPIGQVKMDGQVQTRYNRKNWSSFMIFNCDHPSNKVLHDPKAIINSLPGRDLHAFCWLKDEEIGAMSYEWNYLEGFTSGVSDPKMVHFTEGVPDMAGYENAEYAEEWFAERRRLGRSPAAD